jgi:hypothetical protein
MLTITHLEAVINAWRGKYPPDPMNCTNCKEVNVLAGLYGEMIHHRLASIPHDSLNAQQLEVLRLQRES